MSQLESLSQLCQAAVNGSFDGELKPGKLASSLFQQVNKDEDAVMTDGQDSAPPNTQMQDCAQPSRKRSVLEIIFSPIGVRPSKFMRTA